MTLASSNKAMVSAILGDAGRAVTLLKRSAGTFDNTTQTATVTPTSKSGRARIGDYRDALVDGTKILVGDRRATFIPDDEVVKPEVDDQLTVGSDTYDIIDARPREVAGTFFAFTLQLRLGTASARTT